MDTFCLFPGPLVQQNVEEGSILLPGSMHDLLQEILKAWGHYNENNLFESQLPKASGVPGRCAQDRKGGESPRHQPPLFTDAVFSIWLPFALLLATAPPHLWETALSPPCDPNLAPSFLRIYRLMLGEGSYLLLLGSQSRDCRSLNCP